jgi:hypothetical protein
MVKFIIDTYGPDKMAQLLDIFSEGALAYSALMEALGEDTWSLDNTFRESVGLPLHDLGLETPAEEEPAEVEQAVEEEAETEDQAAEVEEETEPVEEVAETQTESDDVGLDDAASNTEEEVAVESTESDSNRGFGLNCFGSILPLAALGLFIGHGYSRFRRKRQF